MTRGTTRRTFRAEDDLWNEAQRIAAERGENLSLILRDKLREYTEDAQGNIPYPLKDVDFLIPGAPSQIKKLRAVMAVTWDEGFEAGCDSDTRTNPYQEPTSFADRMAARSLAAVQHESWRAKQ